MAVEVDRSSSGAASCAACGASGAKNLCGGCRKVSFCNAECQRAAWKGHKASCREASEARLRAELAEKEGQAGERARSRSPRRPLGDVTNVQTGAKKCAASYNQSNQRLWKAKVIRQMLPDIDFRSFRSSALPSTYS